MTQKPDAEGDDDTVSLWEREESPLLTISIGQDLQLTLRRYPSRDNRWGIHSSVWDGGIATLAYLQHHQLQPHQSNNNEGVRSLYDNESRVLVLDLGSGTGIVGLGLAKLAPRWLHRVYLTDLVDAIPLLNENIKLNHFAGVGTYGERSSIVKAEVLNWGDEDIFLTNQLEKLLTDDVVSHVLLIGADIIYQPKLFQPLLKTIHRIKTMVTSHHGGLPCQVLLGSHSIRSYHGEFWKQARAMGFQIHYKATVRVEMEMATPSSSTTLTEFINDKMTDLLYCPSIVQITIPSPDMNVEDSPVDPQLTTVFELC